MVQKFIVGVALAGISIGLLAMLVDRPADSSGASGAAASSLDAARANVDWTRTQGHPAASSSLGPSTLNSAMSSRAPIAESEVVQGLRQVIADLEAEVLALGKRSREQQQLIDSLTREKEVLLQQASFELALRFLESPDGSVLSEDDRSEAVALIQRLGRAPIPGALSEHLRLAAEMRQFMSDWNRRFQESERDPLIDRRALIQDKADRIRDWKRSVDLIFGHEDALRIYRDE